jgi:hypothetical protein
MNKAKKESTLIAGFACRIDAIRDEALSLIRGAVAEHKIIGTFYKNLGEHYSHDQEPEEYSSSPIVVTHNTDFCSYGGYEAATVYELFTDERGRLLCTLNGEAGEDFDEPLEHIQTEGLLCIVEWLVEYGFIADDPWRCEECGSLAVQAHVWIDSNTKEVVLGAQNRDEHHCADCDANTCQIRESELLENIQKWFDQARIHALEYASGLKCADFDNETAFRKACVEFWEALSIEDKINIWNENN